MAVDTHIGHIRYIIGGGSIYISSSNRRKDSDGRDVLEIKRKRV
jgi:hypothetical protein